VWLEDSRRSTHLVRSTRLWINDPPVMVDKKRSAMSEDEVNGRHLSIAL
jgi:hypothetical protein